MQYEMGLFGKKRRSWRKCGHIPPSTAAISDRRGMARPYEKALHGFAGVSPPHPQQGARSLHPINGKYKYLAAIGSLAALRK